MATSDRRAFAGIVLLLAVVALAVGAGRALADAKRPACVRPADSKPYGSSARLKVYLAARITLLACDRRTGRTRALSVARAMDGEVPGAPVVVVAGRFVAFSVLIAVADGPEFRYCMRVVDGVRGGKPTGTDVAAYTGSHVRGEHAARLPSDLILTPDGTAAWIIPNDEPGVREVRFWPRGGEPHAVARSATIEAGSLALGRRFVYWRDNGQPQSADRSILLPADEQQRTGRD